jgi:CBS domain-containing protein
MPIKVSEIMSAPAITIDVKKNASDAAKLMRKTRRGFLVVVKNKKPVGVISESDLVELVAANKQGRKTKISAIMQTPIVTISPEKTIVDAVHIMKKNNLHRLPVIDGNKLVGVISLTDIARTSPEMLDLLEYRLKMKEQPLEIKEEVRSGICDSCENFSNFLKNVNDQWLCEDCREEIVSEE